MKELRGLFFGLVLAASSMGGYIAWQVNHKPPTTAVGQRVEMLDAHPPKLPIMIMVRDGCHFCEESKPFYKRLGEKVPIVFVSTDSNESIWKHYAAEVPSAQAHHIAKLIPGVRGTPTILVVDAGGKVTKEYIGMVLPEKQDAVLRELTGSE